MKDRFRLVSARVRERIFAREATVEGANAACKVQDLFKIGRNQTFKIKEHCNTKSNLAGADQKLKSIGS